MPVWTLLAKVGGVPIVVDEPNAQITQPLCDPNGLPPAFLPNCRTEGGHPPHVLKEARMLQQRQKSGLMGHHVCTLATPGSDPV
jgi:hypothetical protein